ncbi:hypothetical protein AOQ84DRAFT_391577 [Glonium stellatum]|uniref:LIM zinc-binding domain-containing protein n=1 Tax=Glonium stellatum TaxID=574774 RepID=A0A8E2ET27_9PEZI|nr:hypothetical protein AOQ84DRAFT_391577 [Glonium stellatum]
MLPQQNAYASRQRGRRKNTSIMPYLPPEPIAFPFCAELLQGNYRSRSSKTTVFIVGQKAADTAEFHFSRGLSVEVEKSSFLTQQELTGLSVVDSLCSECGEPILFDCVSAWTLDCGMQIAEKFFLWMGKDSDLKFLCETDYYRQLNMLCFKCGGALRDSYITAFDRKYHVEHFGCSVCNKTFGPHDLYYKGDNDIYCHYHFCVQWASVCHGCGTPISKELVEGLHEEELRHWHPSCFMVYSRWGVRIAMTSIKSQLINFTKRPIECSNGSEVDRVAIQQLMDEAEERVEQVLKTCSSFENLCTTDICDMFSCADSRAYGAMVLTVGRFIAKVDTLFSALDAIILQLKAASAGQKGLCAQREGRLLCDRIVRVLLLCVKSARTSAEQASGVKQEFDSMLTASARCLKLLVGLGLQDSLSLGDNVSQALTMFLKGLETAKESLAVGDDCDCYRCRYGENTRQEDRCGYTRCRVVSNDHIGAFDSLSCPSCESRLGIVPVSRLEQYSHTLHVNLAYAHTINPDRPLSDIFVEAEPSPSAIFSRRLKGTHGHKLEHGWI